MAKSLTLDYQALCLTHTNAASVRCFGVLVDTRYIFSANQLKLSVGVTSHAYLLGIQGLFTQGSRHCRTLGESVGGISEMDSSDWSNGIRYHTFDARSDTEFNR
jgi:hypothetical protein